jgi:hypothetical protein
MIPQALSKIGFGCPKKSFAPRTHKKAQLCITRPPVPSPQPLSPSPGRQTAPRATVIQGPHRRPNIP